MALDTIMEFAKETAHYAGLITPSAICATIIGTVAYYDFYKKKVANTLYEEEVHRSLVRSGLFESKGKWQEAYSVIKYEFSQMPTFAAAYRYATGDGGGRGLFLERRKRK